MNEITMIPVGLLEHHPENPRKDLGDLTELTDSIKKNGIMQNLTVIADPETSKYLVVIGNRRLEAAKAAGLIELPCAVKDLDHKTQISTMLEENMQRQDLTVYEQAQGFQMMMDLGYTAKEIGEKTGFSEKTVKDRIKFTKFNQKKFENAVQQGATLMDLIEISKIEGKQEQNNLLNVAGTNNFRQALMIAKRDQDLKKNTIRLEPLVKEYMEPLPEDAVTWRDYRTVWEPELFADEAEDKIRKKLKRIKKDAEGRKLFYKFDNNYQQRGIIKVYELAEYVAKDAEEEKEERRTERQKSLAKGKHLRKVKAKWAEAYALRLDFIKNYTVANGQGASTMGKIIVRYALNGEPGWNGYLSENHHWEDKYIREALGIPEEPLEKPEQEDPENQWRGKNYFTIWEQAELAGVPMVRIMLAWTCGGGVFWPDDPEHGLYDTYDGRYRPGSGAVNDVDEMYQFLREIGYVMSDMEKQLLDGTHPVYTEDEEKWK